MAHIVLQIKMFVVGNILLHINKRVCVLHIPVDVQHTDDVASYSTDNSGECYLCMELHQYNL